MNFLNPFFLLGALAVAIPVIIHLINLRKPKKVLFSTLSFLNELKKSTIRRIKIKQYLLLTLRCLAILLLAIALARPFLPPGAAGGSDPDEPRVIGIIIDNSPSMNRIGPNGPLIDQAREMARSIIGYSGTGDRFLITVTNGEPRYSATVGPAKAREQVGEIEILNAGNYVDVAAERMMDRIGEMREKQGVIYLISDAQQSQLKRLESLSSDENQRDGDESRRVAFQLVRLENPGLQNLAITNVSLRSRMLSSGSPAELQVEVTNYGDKPTENQFLSLEVEGETAGQHPVSLGSGESRDYSFEVVPATRGDMAGRLLLDGDEVTFDNSRYFVLRTPAARKVIQLTEREENGSGDFKSYLDPALEAAGETTAELSITRSKPDDIGARELQRYDVIIIDGLRMVPEYWFEIIQNHVQSGKGLLFFPSEQGDIQNYNSFLTELSAGRFQNIKGEYASFRPITRLASLIEGHPVFEELFDKASEERINLKLPELFYYYVYEYDRTAGGGTSVLLETENGEPVLVERQFGEGKVMVSTIGPDPGWSNFPVNPLFAPLLYRTVLYLAGTEQGGLKEHRLGTAFEVELAIDPPVGSVELELGDYVTKPEVDGLPDGIRLRYEGKEWRPGILRIQAGSEERLMAVNQDIMESDFDTLPDKELEKMLSKAVTVHNSVDAGSLSGQNLQEELSAAGFGKEIWSWFIWAALILLAAETLVSRLYRAENRG